MHSEFAEIGRALQDLRGLFVERPQHVSPSIERHRYRLNPPLPEETVRRFENDHGIELPTEYRRFITELGNGGVGPGYGVEMLGRMSGVDWSEAPGLVGDLAQPFPYAEAWNERPIDAAQPIDEQYRQQDEYWSCKHVNGAIPICDLGCNLRQCLIVTGPERGHVWFDDRADWKGLYPNSSGGSHRLTFLQWYRLWLEECLIMARR